MYLAVLLPASAFLAAAYLKGLRRAVVFVLFPCLLLLPAYYTWKAPGVPEFTFHNYLFGAAAFSLALGRDRSLLRVHGLDLLIVAWIATAVYSEHVHRGFHDARNLLAGSLLLVASPYVVGKAIGRSERFLIASLGMLVWVGAIIGWSSVYEARMGSNPYDFWRKLWPNSVPWDGALYRAGIRRVAGPFAHPICSGFFFSMIGPLLLYLVDRNLPRRRAEKLFLLGGCFVGILTPVSRGPMMGATIAVMIARLGWSRWRLGIVAASIPFVLVAVPLLSLKISKYVSVQRGDATTEAQETAAYRSEMLERYVEVVSESPWTGYGRYQFPVVGGLKSIDNQYLFLALNHGLPHSVLFLLLHLVAIASLAIKLIQVPAQSGAGRLGWSLIGVLVGAILTQVTVFAGTQTSQLLILLLGVCTGLSSRLGVRAST